MISDDLTTVKLNFLSILGKFFLKKDFIKDTVKACTDTSVEHGETISKSSRIDVFHWMLDFVVAFQNYDHALQTEVTRVV